MKPAVFTLIALALPTTLAAHDANGVAHAHPHGGEALLIVLALAVLAAIWRFRRG